MANLKYCSQCGMLFSSQGGRNICGKCLEEEEKEFEIVRDYVRRHRGANIIEVSEATGVEEEKIVQFLRDGRLESRGMASSVFCERCGTMIASGRYCKKCLQEVDAEIKGLVPQKPKAEPEIKLSKGKIKEKMYSRDKES